jgi:ribonuclease HI
MDASNVLAWARLRFPATWPLRFPHGTGLYTDGSSIKDALTGATRIGAAVFNAGTDATTLVNANGMGPTNTITRAELSAIHAALLDGSSGERATAGNKAGTGTTGHPADAATEPLAIHIFTDSQASIQLIKKARDAPRLLKESKHAPLLHGIVGRITAIVLKGGEVHLHKVKSHTGIRGNDIADAAAKEAADGKNCHYTESADNEPHKGMHWLSHGSTMVSNLTSGVKQAIQAETSLGQSAQHGRAVRSAVG